MRKELFIALVRDRMRWSEAIFIRKGGRGNVMPIVPDYAHTQDQMVYNTINNITDDSFRAARSNRPGTCWSSKRFKDSSLQMRQTWTTFTLTSSRRPVAMSTKSI